jgi:hypothetical protein
MDEEYKKEIEEIITQLTCDKDFICYKSGFEVLCKAKDVGSQSFIECLEEDPSDCKFSVLFGHTNFCECPLRVYIAKKLKK